MLVRADGTQTLALLRGRRGDGKRLARGVEAPRIAANLEHANSRSRGRTWIYAVRAHRQIGSPD